MPDNHIPGVEVARIHGTREQRILKLLKRLGIEPVKAPGVGARAPLAS